MGPIAITLYDVAIPLTASLSSGDAVHVATRALDREGAEALAVVDEGMLVGIVERSRLESAASTAPVESVMETRCVAANLRDPLVYVARLMGDARFVVVMQDGACQAIATRDEIFDALGDASNMLRRSIIQVPVAPKAETKFSAEPAPMSVDERCRRVIVAIQRLGSFDQDLEEVVRTARSGKPFVPLRRVLVDSGIVAEDIFLEGVEAVTGIAFLRGEQLRPDVFSERLLAGLSVRYMRHHGVLPMAVVDGRLFLLMLDPLDDDLVAAITILARRPIERFSTTRALLTTLIDRVATRGDGGESADEADVQPLRDTSMALPAELTPALPPPPPVSPRPEPKFATEQNAVEEVPEAPENGVHDVLEEGDLEVVEFVDRVFRRAVANRASDLHFDAVREGLVVRMRVDGALATIAKSTHEFGHRIAVRLKVIAGVDISKHRVHQDGRASVRVAERNIELRFSSYAGLHGETIVLRLLERGGTLPEPTGLGFHPMAFEALSGPALDAWSGLVLITGPTGSGKTTSMFSLVKERCRADVKVISCEDPVEYELPGMVQSSVAKNRTFAQSLRAMLRQDPDVIVVGEIRDQDTASLAFEAGLTGHLVFSTFHSDDGVSALVRLLELGVEPFVLASGLSCIVAQRLLRRICPDCAVPSEPTERELRAARLSRAELASCSATFRDGAGCVTCGFSGYLGRTTVSEVVVMSDDLREAVLRRASASELRRLARTTPGFLSLREDALAKAISGVVKLEHAVSETPPDDKRRELSWLAEVARRTAPGDTPPA